MTSTLIFPSTVPEALAHAQRLRAEGHRVVGAASIAPNHPQGTFDAWARLPTIYDGNFLSALADVVEAHQVERIIAPSAAVYAALWRWRGDGVLPCALVGEPPIRSAMAQWADRKARAEAAADWLERWGAPAVEPSWMKAVLSLPALIHGASSEDKLVGLCAAALTAPEGDFVEIGVSMGRSAAVLALCARQRRRGLLTVDPFDAEHMVQTDVSASLNTLMADWSPVLVEDAFFAHLHLVTDGPFAHLRARSTDAATRYRAGERFESTGFDPLTTAGQIALLHIDANHDQAAVAADWAAWSPHLAPGAWVVFDDYQWTHGDGPRVVGDAAYSAGAEAGAFCMGGALFFRRANETAPHA